MEQNSFTVTEEEEGTRLDRLLTDYLEGAHSRSYLQKLLREGLVTLNGRPAKASCRVKAEDQVAFSVPDKVLPDILPENIPLDILYEDDDVLVVNKPKNMVVHPAPGHYSHTLVNAVMYHCGSSLSGINGVMRPGIVHRIDKDTTGSVIICKNDAAHQSIAAQLKEHSITRRYIAIACGVIRDDELTIHAPIGRDPRNRKKMAVLPAGQGRDAITHVKVLKRYRDYTCIECRLETGRTHQIRVHLAYIGNPLLGDTVYAPGRKWPYHLEGQCLHARVLGFIHPRTGEYIETVAPLPAYFQKLLKILPEQ